MLREVVAAVRKVWLERLPALRPALGDGLGRGREMGPRAIGAPGDRAMGLRRVDARTGGPVSVRSALIKKAVQTAARELNRSVQRPFRERSLERTRGLKAELKEAREIRAGDREAQKRAMAEVFKRNRVRPSAFVRSGAARDARYAAPPPGALVGAQSDPAGADRGDRHGPGLSAWRACPPAAARGLSRSQRRTRTASCAGGDAGMR